MPLGGSSPLLPWLLVLTSCTCNTDTYAYMHG